MNRVETDPITVLANFNLEQQTNTHGNVRALFKLLDFNGYVCTINDLKDVAGIHRAHASVVLRGLERTGIARCKEGPTPVYGGVTLRWDIHPDIVTVCAGYNRLFASAIRDAMPQRPSTKWITEHSLQGFAANHDVAHLTTLEEISSWLKQSVDLHPQEIFRRALGSFAIDHDVDDTVKSSIQARIKQQARLLKEQPAPAVVIPRQLSAADRSEPGQTIAATLSSGHGLPARAPAAQQA